MAWRAERQVNLVFAELHPLATATPRHALARTIFYGGYSGVARDGSPVFVERLGKADLAGVNREGEPVLELVMLAYIQYLESCFRTVRHVSAQRGALTKVLIVVDAGGVSLSTVRHISVIKAIAKIGPANYPETTRKVYIVNAPAGAWVVGSSNSRLEEQACAETTRLVLTPCLPRPPCASLRCGVGRRVAAAAAPHATQDPDPRPRLPARCARAEEA